MYGPCDSPLLVKLRVPMAPTLGVYAVLTMWNASCSMYAVHHEMTAVVL